MRSLLLGCKAKTVDESKLEIIVFAGTGWPLGVDGASNLLSCSHTTGEAAREGLLFRHVRG